MARLRFFACLVCSALSVAAGSSASATRPDGPKTQKNAAPTDDKDIPPEVAALRDELAAAINGRKFNELLPLLHEDVVFTTQDGKNIVPVRRHAGVRSYFERLLVGPGRTLRKVRIKPVIEKFTALDGSDAAIVFGTCRADCVRPKGDAFQVNIRWSAALVMIDGTWRIANVHYSINPFDNPVRAHQQWMATWSIYKTGAVAVLIGFAIGILVMRVFGRPRPAEPEPMTYRANTAPPTGVPPADAAISRPPDNRPAEENAGEG